MAGDSRILLTKEEAERKAEEKKNQVGIVFENINTGEIRIASTVEHIAAFFNSSDEGPNAKNKQDFGWRLSPEDLIELEETKRDGNVMERIAAQYQIPIEDVADYNVLKYMASKRFKKAAQEAEAQGKDHESDYQRRVRENRESRTSKKSTGEKTTENKESKPASSKPRTVNRDAGDGQFVSDEEAKQNPGTTVTETVKQNDEKKVEKSEQKPDNKSNS